jgi:hypothetical protein
MIDVGARSTPRESSILPRGWRRCAATRHGRDGSPWRRAQPRHDAPAPSVTRPALGPRRLRVIRGRAASPIPSTHFEPLFIRSPLLPHFPPSPSPGRSPRGSWPAFRVSERLGPVPSQGARARGQRRGRGPDGTGTVRKSGGQAVRDSHGLELSPRHPHGQKSGIARLLAKPCPSCRCRRAAAHPSSWTWPATARGLSRRPPGFRQPAALAPPRFRRMRVVPWRCDRSAAPALAREAAPHS